MLGNTLELEAVNSILEDLNKIENAKRNIISYSSKTKFDSKVQEEFEGKDFIDESAAM